MTIFAFPCADFDRPLNQKDFETNDDYRGLTKRELFAAMAMQGLAANNGFTKTGLTMESMATNAVQSADALIAELDK